MKTPHCRFTSLLAFLISGLLLLPVLVQSQTVGQFQNWTYYPDSNSNTPFCAEELIDVFTVSDGFIITAVGGDGRWQTDYVSKIDTTGAVVWTTKGQDSTFYGLSSRPVILDVQLFENHIYTLVKRAVFNDPYTSFLDPEYYLTRVRVSDGMEEWRTKVQSSSPIIEFSSAPIRPQIYAIDSQEVGVLFNLSSSGPDALFRFDETSGIQFSLNPEFPSPTSYITSSFRVPDSIGGVQGFFAAGVVIKVSDPTDTLWSNASLSSANPVEEIDSLHWAFFQQSTRTLYKVNIETGQVIWTYDMVPSVCSYLSSLPVNQFYVMTQLEIRDVELFGDSTMFVSYGNAKISNLSTFYYFGQLLKINHVTGSEEWVSCFRPDDSVIPLYAPAGSIKEDKVGRKYLSISVDNQGNPYITGDLSQISTPQGPTLPATYDLIDLKHAFSSGFDGNSGVPLWENIIQTDPGLSDLTSEGKASLIANGKLYMLSQLQNRIGNLQYPYTTNRIAVSKIDMPTGTIESTQSIETDLVRFESEIFKISPIINEECVVFGTEGGKVIARWLNPDLSVKWTWDSLHTEMFSSRIVSAGVTPEGYSCIVYRWNETISGLPKDKLDAKMRFTLGSGAKYAHERDDSVKLNIIILGPDGKLIKRDSLIHWYSGNFNPDGPWYPQRDLFGKDDEFLWYFDYDVYHLSPSASPNVVGGINQNTSSPIQSDYGHVNLMLPDPEHDIVWLTQNYSPNSYAKVFGLDQMSYLGLSSIPFGEFGEMEKIGEQLFFLPTFYYEERVYFYPINYNNSPPSISSLGFLSQWEFDLPFIQFPQPYTGCKRIVQGFDSTLYTVSEYAIPPSLVSSKFVKLDTLGIRKIDEATGLSLDVKLYTGPTDGLDYVVDLFFDSLGEQLVLFTLIDSVNHWGEEIQIPYVAVFNDSLVQTHGYWLPQDYPTSDRILDMWQRANGSFLLAGKKIRSSTGPNGFLSVLELPCSDTTLEAGLTYSVVPNSSVVTFSDTTQGATKSIWQFEPGAFAKTSSASYKFQGPGSYPIQLSSFNGCAIDTVRDTVLITCVPPQGNFVITTNLLVASFVNSSVSNSSASYLWDFGDGQSASVASPTHTYAIPDTYQVSLVVVDSCASDTISQSVIIQCPDLNAGVDYVANGLNVAFNDTTSGVVSRLWLFGDGNSSSLANPVHSYATPNTYQVSLIVGNNCIFDTVSLQVVVTCENLTPYFGYVDTLLAVTFSDSSNLSTTSWLWDFGDGSLDSVQNPIHLYSSPGSYTVTLTVSDSCSSQSVSDLITIDCLPPGISFSYSSNLTTVSFDDTVSSIVPVLRWWSFGDGDTMLGEDPVHVYDSAGVYEVILIVANSCSSDTIVDTVVVICDQPVASFTHQIIGNEVTFSNTSQAGDNFFWNFGDGQTDTLSHPIHLYDCQGTYFVTLVSENFCGLDTFSLAVTTDSSALISGMVLSSTGTPLSSSLVYLVEYDPMDSLLIGIDTTGTSMSGEFSFFVTAGKEFLVKAAPDSSQFPMEVPTYADTAFLFSDASPIISLCDTTIMFSTKAGQNPGGSGFVGGYVYDGANKNSDPVTGINLFLVTYIFGGEDVIAFANSNSDGAVSFPNLPLGSYLVFADVPGIQNRQLPALLTIDQVTPRLEDVEFILHASYLEINLSTAISNEKPLTQNRYQVIPNPSDAVITVSGTGNSFNPLTISVLDLRGRLLRIQEVSGITPVRLNLEDLSPGTYFLKVEGYDGSCEYLSFRLID